MPRTLQRRPFLAAVGVLLASISSAAVAAPVHDRAGNRLETLIEQPDAQAGAEQASARFCTADRQWCVRTAREGDDQASQLEIEHHLPVQPSRTPGSSPSIAAMPTLPAPISRGHSSCGWRPGPTRVRYRATRSRPRWRTC